MKYRMLVLMAACMLVACGNKNKKDDGPGTETKVDDPIMKAVEATPALGWMPEDTRVMMRFEATGLIDLLPWIEGRPGDDGPRQFMQEVGRRLPQLDMQRPLFVAVATTGQSERVETVEMSALSGTESPEVPYVLHFRVMLPAKAEQIADLERSLDAVCAEGGELGELCSMVAKRDQRPGYLVLDAAVSPSGPGTLGVPALTSALEGMKERGPDRLTPAAQAFAEHKGPFAVYMPFDATQALGTISGMASLYSALEYASPEYKQMMLARGIATVLNSALLQDPNAREYTDGTILVEGDARGMRVDVVQSTTAQGKKVHEAGMASPVAITVPSLSEPILELDANVAVGPALDAAMVPGVVADTDDPLQAINSFGQVFREAGFYGALASLSYPHGIIRLVRDASRDKRRSGLPFEDPVGKVRGISVRVGLNATTGAPIPFMAAATFAFTKEAVTQADIDSLMRGAPPGFVEVKLETGAQTHDEVRVAVGTTLAAAFPAEAGKLTTHGARLELHPERVDRESAEWKDFARQAEYNPVIRALVEHGNWRFDVRDTSDKRTLQVLIDASPTFTDEPVALVERTPEDASDPEWTLCTLKPIRSTIQGFNAISFASVDQRAELFAQSAKHSNEELDACARAYPARAEEVERRKLDMQLWAAEFVMNPLDPASLELMRKVCALGSKRACERVETVGVLVDGLELIRLDGQVNLSGDVTRPDGAIKVDGYVAGSAVHKDPKAAARALHDTKEASAQSETMPAVIPTRLEFQYSPSLLVDRRIEVSRATEFAQAMNDSDLVSVRLLARGDSRRLIAIQLSIPNGPPTEVPPDEEEEAGRLIITAKEVRLETSEGVAHKAGFDATSLRSAWVKYKETRAASVNEITVWAEPGVTMERFVNTVALVQSFSNQDLRYVGTYVWDRRAVYSTKAPKIDPAKPVVMGALDKEQIRDVIRKHRSEARYCYEKQLAKNPSLAGTIKVKFVISQSGSVVSASTSSDSMGNEEVTRCLVDSVKRWTFPEPRGGGIVVVNYPFAFTTK